MVTSCTCVFRLRYPDFHTGKMGICSVNSDLATAIRTFAVLLISWGMVFLTNAPSGILEISK